MSGGTENLSKLLIGTTFACLPIQRPYGIRIKETRAGILKLFFINLIENFERLRPIKINPTIMKTIYVNLATPNNPKNGWTNKAILEANVVPITKVSRKFSDFNLVYFSKKVPGIIKEKITIKIDNTKNLIPMFAIKKIQKIGIMHANAKNPRLSSLLSKITSIALRLDRIVL